MSRVATATDLAVGKKLRLRRRLLGLSQTVLGDKLGVTFQQVQKYENGTNRISSGTLRVLADTLDVPLDYFFEQPPRVNEALGLEAVDTTIIDSFLNERNALRLVKCFVRMTPGRKKALVALAENLISAPEGVTGDSVTD